MTTVLVKVDRVRSVEEAAELEALGAGVISVALDRDPRFADERTIGLDLAASIGRSLRRARFVASVDFVADPARALRGVRAVEADLVQPIGAVIPSDDVRGALSTAGIGIVYAGIEIAHDEDPSWVLSRYTGTPDLGATMFQIDVLPEYRNSWEFLRDEAPGYDEEFQLADLNELGRAHDIVAAFNFTPQNVCEVVSYLPQVRGIALTLADNVTRDDLHFLRYGAAVDVLRAMRGR